MADCVVHSQEILNLQRVMFTCVRSYVTLSGSTDSGSLQFSGHEL